MIKTDVKFDIPGGRQDIKDIAAVLPRDLQRAHGVAARSSAAAGYNVAAKALADATETDPTRWKRYQRVFTSVDAGTGEARAWMGLNPYPERSAEAKQELVDAGYSSQVARRRGVEYIPFPDGFDPVSGSRRSHGRSVSARTGLPGPEDHRGQIMGREISCYLDASVRTMKDAYEGWHIYARGEKPEREKEFGSQVRKAEEGWSVEVGVAFAEMCTDGYNNRARLQCRALVRYAAKAVTHDSLPQAMDIAASLGAYINHGTMIDADGLAVGEIVREVRAFPEAETIVKGGVRVATGAYQIVLQWVDETVVSPEIDIEGYTVQSPTAPAGQPDVGDFDEDIESIELQVRPQSLLDELEDLEQQSAAGTISTEDATRLQEFREYLFPAVGDHWSTRAIISVNIDLPDDTRICGAFCAGTDAEPYRGQDLIIPLDGLGTLAAQQVVRIDEIGYRVTNVVRLNDDWWAVELVST